MSAKRTCACMACRKCYERERARKVYRLQAYGKWDPHGDLEKVRAHLDYLRDNRMGVKRIEELSGVARSTVLRIRLGKSQRVIRATADRLLAVQPDQTLRIDPTGTSRRIRALMALGWSTYVLAARLNTTQAQVWVLSKGRAWVSPERAGDVRRVYGDLCMTLGPSDVTRRRAAALGYAPPLAWDDIDDPAERPAGRYNERRHHDDIDPAVVDRLLAGKPTRSTRAERDEAMRRWKAMGRPERALCEALGWKDGRYGKGEVA